MRRVVVTGMGALSALGNGVASTWSGLLEGRSGVRTIERFDPSRVDSKIAAEVRDFDSSGVLDRKEQRRTDRYIQFGLVVARQAMDQAGLPGRMEGAEAERTGVIQRTTKARITRDGVTVYTGSLSSLKRFKDDVREVREGLECGIGIENFNDLKVGDRIESFRMEEVKRTLQPAAGGAVG